jgi:hypothetical protein
MIGSGGRFMSAMVQRTCDCGLCASQSWLLDHQIQAQLAKVRAAYRQKALTLRSWVADQLGGELECVRGGCAGFYLYLTFRHVETCEGSPFFRYLTRTTGDESVDGPAGNRNPRVLYIPGQICVNPKGDLAGTGRRQLRLSYGYENLDTLCRAISFMKEAAEFARSNPQTTQ